MFMYHVCLGLDYERFLFSGDDSFFQKRVGKTLGKTIFLQLFIKKRDFESILQLSTQESFIV